MGRRSRNVSTFNAHDSNTVCDITGFKVKRSEVMRRWEGFYVIPEAWHERQPQDFPVVPTKQHVVKDVRTENTDIDPIPTFEMI
jgi:hypothetical protein